MSDTFKLEYQVESAQRLTLDCQAFGDSFARYHRRAALALILAMVVTLEIVAGWRSEPQNAENPSILLQATSAAHPADIRLPMQSCIRNWSSAAVARPLFRPSRAPFAPVVSPASLPRLAGIVITTQDKIGIFIIGQGAPVIAREGAPVGRFKLLSIAANSVLLSGSSGIRTLHVSYDSNPAPRARAITADSDDEDGFAGSDSWPIQSDMAGN